jgi:hypothetical protein
MRVRKPQSKGSQLCKYFPFKRQLRRIMYQYPQGSCPLSSHSRMPAISHRPCPVPSTDRFQELDGPSQPTRFIERRKGIEANDPGRKRDQEKENCDEYVSALTAFIHNLFTQKYGNTLTHIQLIQIKPVECVFKALHSLKL